jgi:hypothetical protein
MLGTINVLLIALAREQLAAVGKTEWSQQIHTAAIVRLVAALFGLPRNDPRCVRLFVILSEHGIGGNASQFRQWLESDEAKVLPPVAKRGKATADSLLA